jgi:WD40 repeat protein
VKTGKLLHELPGDGSDYLAVYSPDGKWLATAGDGSIGLWHPDTGKELRRWQAHTSSIQSIAFAPDSSVLASAGSFDHAIRRWNPATGKEIDPLPGHGGIVVSLAYRPDGKTLMTWGNDRKVVEWDLALGRERRQLFTGPLAQLKEWRNWMLQAVSPDGKVAAWTRREEIPNTAVRLWDTELGKDLPHLGGHQGWIAAVRFSPDGKLLATGCADGIRIWDVLAGKPLHHLKVPQPQPADRWQGWTLTFSPDGKLLAWFGVDNLIGLCEVASGKELRRWDSQQSGTEALVFSPDSQALVSADGQTVRVWDTATGKERSRFANPTYIGSVAFSPSGRMLAIGESPGSVVGSKGIDRPSTICLWDVYSGQEIRRLEAPQTMVFCLAFAADGRTLASGGGDSTVLLWDLTGRTKSGKPKPAALTPIELEGLWSSLAGDAPQADAALWAMVFSPQQSLPMLNKVLPPVPPADPKRVADLVRDLDSDNFTVRTKAVRALEELGEAAEGALWRTLADHPSLEVQRRVEQVLAKRGKDVIRQLRALEVLEHLGTPQARQLLETLAQASPNPRVARAAAAALERLAKRSAGVP